MRQQGLIRMGVVGDGASRGPATSKRGITAMGRKRRRAPRLGNRQELSHRIPFLVTRDDPFLDGSQHGTDSRFHRLHPLGRDVQAMLQDQREEILQAGEKGYQWNGLRLFGDGLQMF